MFGFESRTQSAGSTQRSSHEDCITNWMRWDTVIRFGHLPWVKNFILPCQIKKQLKLFRFFPPVGCLRVIREVYNFPSRWNRRRRHSKANLFTKFSRTLGNTSIGTNSRYATTEKRGRYVYEWALTSFSRSETDREKHWKHTDDGGDDHCYELDPWKTGENIFIENYFFFTFELPSVTCVSRKLTTGTAYVHLVVVSHFQTLSAWNVLPGKYFPRKRTGLIYTNRNQKKKNLSQQCTSSAFGRTLSCCCQHTHTSQRKQRHPFMQQRWNPP